MRRQIACAAALVAFGTALLTGGGVAVADSAGQSHEVTAKGPFRCIEWGRYGVTDRRTPVHTGMSASSKVVGHLAKGTKIRGYYRCTNSAGNIWYEITGNLEGAARFVWSGNV